MPENMLALLRARRQATEAHVDAAPQPAAHGVALELGGDDHREAPEQDAVRRIIARLAEEGQGLGEAELQTLVRSLVASQAGGLNRAQLEAVEQELLQSLGGRLGVLQPLLEDPTVTEVMVNGPGQVYVERAGRLELTAVRFRDDRSVQALVERIVAPLGRSFSVAQPTVDARLRDGSRVNAVRPPVSLLGTTVTIRRFPRSFSLAELVQCGAFGAEQRYQGWNPQGPYPADGPPWAVLAWCVRHRQNLIVSGGTGSGKTTMLGALTGCIPHTERVVFIEDAAELQPRLSHVVRLEARPPNAEGRGEVTIQHLVINALRMRPDRIVVGEVRDIEALDMLLAMNTGHDGSLTTIHANSPDEVFNRLVQATTLRSVGAVSGERRTIVAVAAAALKVIVHVVRDGVRRVDAIVAVEGSDPRGEPSLRPLFSWDGQRLIPTGQVPVWARTGR